MARRVTGLAGLALLGSAEVGPLRFEAPCVAWSSSVGAADAARPSFPLVVEPAAAAKSGTRAIVLRQGDSRLQLDFPVLAPEITGAPGGAADLGSGCWYLHWPVPPADWEVVTAGAPELVVLGNARVLFAEGEPFVRAVQEIRERLGGRPLLWAPRVALPHRIAYLAYVGVDLLDATESIWQNRTGMNLDATMGATSAPAVSLEQVASSLGEELARVRAAAQGGRLRELVEIRISAEPALAEHLRYADRHLATLLEERTPVVGDGQHRYVLRESRRRPEVQRFVRRFLARYRPPLSKKILLILPCSKTKPYRASPSHRSYRRALEGLQPIERVHIASVTSPLGLVPRELEDVPPARHYDIPVTGEWDEEERSTVVAAVRHVLSSGAYDHVVVHLDPNEYGFLRDVANGHAHTIWSATDERTLSPPALASLRQAVGDALESCTPAPGGPLTVVREELHEIAAFQFGREAADRLFAPPVRLAGRPWFQRVVAGGGADLATWRDQRGLFQLTVAGAHRLAGTRSLEVEVAPALALKGDLFTPGVARADPAIRVGDAVVLVRAGSVIGAGEATLPGRLMTQLRHGKAVEVRHRGPAALAEPTLT